MKSISFVESQNFQVNYGFQTLIDFQNRISSEFRILEKIDKRSKKYKIQQGKIGFLFTEYHKLIANLG